MGVSSTMTISRRDAKTPVSEQNVEHMPFIAFEKPGGSKDAEHQKIIRKHLGRRRRKHTPEEKAVTPTSPRKEILSVLCVCDSDLSFLQNAAPGESRLMSVETCANCKKNRLVEVPSEIVSPISIMETIEGGLGDPFEALPIPAKPYTHDLIKHFLNVTAPSTLPLPHLAHLFPNNAAARSLLAHDEVLLRSAISIASMHQDYLRGSQAPTAISLEEHGTAIALLNNRLSDTSTRSSDGLIIAVAILAACQMIAGNFESWQAHMFGLLRLLQIRGGLGANDQIRDGVFECDVVGATIFGVPPFLAAYADSRSRRIYGSSSLCYELIVLSDDLRHTFVEIRDLCEYFEQISCEPNVEKESINEFVKRRSDIEYQLLAANDQSPEDRSIAATKCCRAAAQIFINLTFRKLGPASLIHERLAIQLREAMMAFDEDETSQHATSMILWASTLGFIALGPGPLRLWFAGWIFHCVDELDICSIEDLTYHLRKIAWLDQLLGIPCAEMWNELQQMQSMGVELKITSET